MLRKKTHLSKSMSLSCVHTPELKDKILDDVVQDKDESMPHYFKSMTIYSLVLVDFKQFPDQFSNFVKENVIDSTMQNELERGNVINWCRTVKPLFSLKTRGDGNCLLHAVTLAMWGIHDSSAFLRRLVFVALVSDGQKNGGRFQQRWQRTKAKFNEQIIQGGIHLNSHEWESEWQQVIHDANDVKKPTSPNQPLYDYLEDIHIFVLSNVIRRPIIILANNEVRSVTGTHIGENHFAGMYLPLLWNPKDCVKCPIVLGYASCHFTPLIGMEDSSPYNTLKLQPENLVPLVTKNLENLCLHYLTEHEERYGYDLLKQYLEVTEVNWTRSDSIQFVPCAKLKYKQLEQYNVLKDHIFALQRVFQSESDAGLSQQYGEQMEWTEDKLNFNNSDQELKPVFKKKEKSTDCSSSDSDDKLLNIVNKTRDSDYDKLCRFKKCENRTSAKFYPYCKAHKRKRSNSATYEDEFFLKKGFENIDIDDKKQARHSLNGQHSHFNDTSKPCRVPGCSLYGLHKWDYLCSEHQNKNSPLKRDSLLGERSVSPCDWQKCRTPNKKCPQPGDANFGGLCKDCFVAEEKKSKGNSTRCRNSQCDFFGNEEFNYYCSTCVLQFAFQNSQHYVGTEKNTDIPIAERESMDSMVILGLLPDRPESERMNAREFYKCQYHNCRKLSTESTLGYCTHHFIQLFKSADIAIPTVQEVIKFKQDINTKRSESRTKSESCPSTRKPDSHLQQTKFDDFNKLSHENQDKIQECSTPKCNGIRCHNEHGLCFFCYDALLHGKKFHQQVSKQKMQSKSDEDIIESAAAESSINESPQRNICKGPICHNIGESVFNGLCAECHDTLAKRHADKMQENLPAYYLEDLPSTSKIVAPSPAKRLIKKCRSSHCSMFGTEAQKGYCSKCFNEATSTGKQPPDQGLTAQEKLRQVRLNMMTQAELMNLLPLDKTNSPKKCITAECDFYGDPVFRGFCSQCAEKRGMLSGNNCTTRENYHNPDGIHFEQEYAAHPIDATQQQRIQPDRTAENETYESGYIKAMLDVENKSRSKKCKTVNCENYGSAVNRGYCTSCS